MKPVPARPRTALLSVSIVLAALVVQGLPAQTTPSAEAKLDLILQTVRQLQEENRQLAKEVKELRALIAPQARIEAPPAPQVRVDAHPAPQTNVEAPQVKAEAPTPDTLSGERDVLWRLPDNRLAPPGDPAVSGAASRRFSLLGANAGRTREGNLAFTGKGRYFAPMGRHQAAQAEGEFLYYGGKGTEGRQEGQFDFGLVNRWGRVQASGFASFKYLDLRQYHNGGALGQAAFTLDYIFGRGRAGFFGTKAFLNETVLNRAMLGPASFTETYARVVDQAGASAQFGVWGNAYIEGNVGMLFRQGGSNRPGGMLRLVQPVSRLVAVTVEGGWNETLVTARDSARVTVGLQFGRWISPREYERLDHPVPVDVPRMRYELLTRRIGNSPPIADAGPEQIGAPAGAITLDGSASRDPDGDPLQYSWTQISGPSVNLSGVNNVKATFSSGDGQTYVFRLTVTDPGGLTGTATTRVSVRANPAVRILRFMAQPDVIKAGQSSTLVWEVENADTVEISGLGTVAAHGTSSVAPAQTTVYHITARNRSGEVNETASVQVQEDELRILSFYASPTNIQRGQSSTLIWSVENADSVEISGLGPVSLVSSSSVTPSETTGYVITARRGAKTVTAQAAVTIAAGKAPKIIRFSGTPPEIAAGESASLTWQVDGATSISISPALGTVAASGSQTISPRTTTTYTVNAGNDFGTSSATVVISVFEPPKILDFVATPATITLGGSTTLAWKTENATSVVLTGVGNVDPNGSIKLAPGETVSYTLIAYGKRGNVSAFVLVKVQLPVADPVCVTGPDQLTMNSKTTLDGSRSYDPSGLALTYSWTFSSYVRDQVLPPSAPPGQATLSNPNSSSPNVTMTQWGEYSFVMQVQNARGNKCSKTTRVSYIDP